MIHDIAPHRFDNAFSSRLPAATDVVLYYEGDRVLLCGADDAPYLPCFGDCRGIRADALQYLFCIDNIGYFLAEALPAVLPASGSLRPVAQLRTLADAVVKFAGVTGAQLQRWRESNRYCGRCGQPMAASAHERALCCPACGNTVYPKISPAVIVAVTDGEKLLMVRTKLYPQRFSLVAGYVEVGESLEQAVAREVLEETGVRIANIRYFASQPWSFSDTMMVGFTAELTGESTTAPQESEITEVRWLTPEQVPVPDSDISMGGTLIRRHLAQNGLPG
ncbi:MAG: NAD(+) diphosphatase [Eubacteriales bacterium]|nr:NAD(+) diphosphatase [Eubacteriales bacterium]